MRRKTHRFLSCLYAATPGLMWWGMGLTPYFGAIELNSISRSGLNYKSITNHSSIVQSSHSITWDLSRMGRETQVVVSVSFHPMQQSFPRQFLAQLRGCRVWLEGNKYLARRDWTISVVEAYGSSPSDSDLIVYCTKKSKRFELKLLIKRSSRAHSILKKFLWIVQIMWLQDSSYSTFDFARREKLSLHPPQICLRWGAVRKKAWIHLFRSSSDAILILHIRKLGNIQGRRAKDDDGDLPLTQILRTDHPDHSTDHSGWNPWSRTFRSESWRWTVVCGEKTVIGGRPAAKVLRRQSSRAADRDCHSVNKNKRISKTFSRTGLGLSSIHTSGWPSGQI